MSLDREGEINQEYILGYKEMQSQNCDSYDASLIGVKKVIRQTVMQFCRTLCSIRHRPWWFFPFLRKPIRLVCGEDWRIFGTSLDCIFFRRSKPFHSNPSSRKKIELEKWIFPAFCSNCRSIPRNLWKLVTVLRVSQDFSMTKTPRRELIGKTLDITRLFWASITTDNS